MKYNLTDSQKQLARLLVELQRKAELKEHFCVRQDDEMVFVEGEPQLRLELNEVSLGSFDALAESQLLCVKDQSELFRKLSRTCTLTGLIYTAVDSNFAEDAAVRPISILAQPHPPEIAMSLDRLREKFPDPKKLGFLVMRFTGARPFQRIVDIIKKTGKGHGLEIIRADETEFHADLWGNVRTYLHGCGFGIAVYERIETNEPNANIGLEVGYLMAMNKPVLLLKDKTVTTLQADLTGKLYKPFDPHDPEATVPGQLTKWLEDNGIVVPKRP